MSTAISIRIPDKVLKKYKDHAEKIGIHYQTLINVTLASYPPYQPQEQPQTDNN